MTKRKQIGLYLNVALVPEIDVAARKCGLSRSQLVEEILRSYLRGAADPRRIAHLAGLAGVAAMQQERPRLRLKGESA